jgi:hypothetical protein
MEPQSELFLLRKAELFVGPGKIKLTIPQESTVKHLRKAERHQPRGDREVGIFRTYQGGAAHG